LNFRPLDAIRQNEEFILLASVEDLRTDATGVYSAYLDLLFPSDFFTTPSDSSRTTLVYGPDFGNGPTGEVSPGRVDELGTFAGSVTPPGPGEQALAGIG
jgi:hypothetical protein